MTAKRKIEIFSAGCPVCEESIELVKRIASPGFDISVLNMNDTDVSARAKTLGIGRVPSVVIDGKLAECCVSEGLTEASLRAAGIDQA